MPWTKMLYTPLAYNNSVDSVSKFKPINLITRHIGTDGPFNIDLEKRFLNDYITKKPIVYKKLYSDLNTYRNNKKK